MEITDKELLAICNLSNLKMEFAEIVYKDEVSGEERNHTISSLLEAEREAILNNDDSKRVFILEKEEENQENKTEIETDNRIYKDIIDLKKEAGMVYECFETEEDFTKKWEILCAYDGYKLIAEYSKIYFD